MKKLIICNIYKLENILFKYEVLHGGRPRDEEPHVKKSARRKKDIDYILKVDLVRYMLPFENGMYK